MDLTQLQKRISVLEDLMFQGGDRLNARMHAEIISYDAERKSIMMLFPVEGWEGNPVGNMHGGMICAALDIAMGCASYLYSEAAFTPTIQISVNFVKAIACGSDLYVEGILDHAGSRLAQARAIAYDRFSGDISATANGSYAINTRR